MTKETRIEFLPYGRQHVTQEDIDAVCDVLRSDWLTQGPTIPLFEKKLSSTLNAKPAVACATGTAALHMAMMALDIGPETEAARNYLFGFRTELYASAFPKVIQEWCEKHGITATGHQDQEEVVNPVSVAGDLMKCFKYQDIPGVDKIGGDRPAERFYKVISSAAYNWDKALA